MGSSLGSLKSAATKTGCSLEEWQRRRAHGEQWCMACKSWKPVDDFHVDRSRPRGISNRCKNCSSLMVAATRYRLTTKDVKKIKNAGCGICGRTKEQTFIEVDHDHKTGKVRGALCCRCNGALGRFKDSPDLLKKALKYLEDR